MTESEYNLVQSKLNEMLEKAFKTELIEELKLTMLFALTNGSGQLHVNYDVEHGMTFKFRGSGDKP